MLRVITDQWPPLPAVLPQQVGGRVSFFSSHWQDICASQAVLDLISGVTLEFNSPLPHAPNLSLCSQRK